MYRSLIAICGLVTGLAVAAAPGGGVLHGNPAAGAAIYDRCLACHAFSYDRTGPKHCGLLGRRAGSEPGFAYSDAMKQSKLVWNERTLDRFLADPLKVVPGTSMGYAGVKDDQERADLIAYLKQKSGAPECKQ